MRRDSIALSRYRSCSSIVIVDLLRLLSAGVPASERKLDYRESRDLARARRSGALPRLSRSWSRKLAANGSRIRSFPSSYVYVSRRRIVTYIERFTSRARDFQENEM